MNFSIVIITHNNFSMKSGCIETVLLSIERQRKINCEIIVVDNDSTNQDKKKLRVLSLKHPNVKFLFNFQNNISKGRNLGALSAKYDYIIFMDDDTILNDNLTLASMQNMIKDHLYGYSATRLWTVEGWYENNKDKIHEKILKNTTNYAIITTEPKPEVRRKKNNRHLVRTYIGNFGFIKKEALKNVGMWNEDYCGYGVEDDTMAFKLYMKYGRPLILNGISVIHVWHEINKKNYLELNANKNKFDLLLKNNGVKIFHVGRILYEEENVIEWI